MRSIFLRLSAVFIAASALTFAQGLTCQATANPPLVHAEGVAERLGDIVLTCTGGTPGATVKGSFSVFLNTYVTNTRSENSTVDVALSIDTGSGPVLATVPARLVAPNQIGFNGVTLTLPSTGAATIRISGIRGDMTQLPAQQFEYRPARAWVAINGASQFAVSSSQFDVAVGAGSLYGLTLDRAIFCTPEGLPLPAISTLVTLLNAHIPTYPVRVTEGFTSAFHPADPGATNGVRILVRIKGIASGAQAVAADVIAGSSATRATSAGDFGSVASPGQYAPSENGSLLLVRVMDADAQGAGGEVLSSPVWGNFQEVPVTDGEALLVYEVVDADPAQTESAQIPIFFGWEAGTTGKVLESVELLLGPISTVGVASQTAPVPRFLGGSLGSDCEIIGDCDGSYLPRVSVTPDPNVPLEYEAEIGGPADVRYVVVRKETEQPAEWTMRAEYKSGANWLRLSQTSGVGDARVRVDALPGGLAPGNYEATLVVDAGLGGTVTLPVKFTVSESDKPIVNAIVNAATFAPGPLVRGSFATLMGLFPGQQRTVTFDGVPATLVYEDAKQINLIVPASLTPRTSSKIEVSIDGKVSTPQWVTLSHAAPGIFQNGILNQDNSLNAAGKPAAAGSVIQIWATGVMQPEGGTVQVRLRDQVINDLEYSGEAPGIPGLQQVNVRVPAGITNSTDLQVCNVSGFQPVCSPAVKLYVQ